jgi:hypothetical protein
MGAQHSWDRALADDFARMKRRRDEGGVRSSVPFAPSRPDYAQAVVLRAEDELPSPPRVTITPPSSFQVAFRRERQQAEMINVLIASATMQEGSADYE